MMGAVSPVTDLEAEEGVREAAAQAASLLNSRMNSLSMHRLVKVHSANKQVVAGLKWSMRLELSPSSCQNNGQHQPEDPSCKLLTEAEGGQPKLFDVELLDQAWMTPRFSLLSFTPVQAKATVEDAN